MPEHHGAAGNTDLVVPPVAGIGVEMPVAIPLAAECLVGDTHTHRHGSRDPAFLVHGGDALSLPDARCHYMFPSLSIALLVCPLSGKASIASMRSVAGTGPNLPCNE